MRLFHRSNHRRWYRVHGRAVDRTICAWIPSAQRLCRHRANRSPSPPYAPPHANIWPSRRNQLAGLLLLFLHPEVWISHLAIWTLKAFILGPYATIQMSMVKFGKSRLVQGLRGYLDHSAAVHQTMRLSDRALTSSICWTFLPCFRPFQSFLQFPLSVGQTPFVCLVGSHQLRQEGDSIIGPCRCCFCFGSWNLSRTS